MPKALTETERQRILDLHAEGMSRNDIARKVGRSPGTITNVVHGAGLTFDRAPEVAAATEAKRIDNAAKRAVLETRFLDEALLLMDEMHKPHTVFNFGGRDNTYAEHELDEPDVQAKATLVRAAKVAVDSAVRLAQVDAATKGAAEGKSMLGALGAALQAAYDALPEQTEDDGEDAE